MLPLPTYLIIVPVILPASTIKSNIKFRSVNHIGIVIIKIKVIIIIIIGISNLLLFFFFSS